MIVRLSPKYKFVCDRCGKEKFPNDNGYIEDVKEVFFAEDMMINRPFKKTGQLCEECYNDFIQLAENFFDEVNRRADNEQQEITDK